MLGTFYINITLHFLYFHLTIICLQLLCTNIIINRCTHINPVLRTTYLIEVKMN